MSENNKIAVEAEDLIKVWRILENLRVSLDRIGAINRQGRDKMLQAQDEYLNPELYKEIADAWYILESKYLTRDKFPNIEKSIKYFELKKYD